MDGCLGRPNENGLYFILSSVDIVAGAPNSRTDRDRNAPCCQCEPADQPTLPGTIAIRYDNTADGRCEEGRQPLPCVYIEEQRRWRRQLC